MWCLVFSPQHLFNFSKASIISIISITFKMSVLRNNVTMRTSTWSPTFSVFNKLLSKKTYCLSCITCFFYVINLTLVFLYETDVWYWTSRHACWKYRHYKYSKKKYLAISHKKWKIHKISYICYLFLTHLEIWPVKRLMIRLQNFVMPKMTS